MFVQAVKAPGPAAGQMRRLKTGRLGKREGALLACGLQTMMQGSGMISAHQVGQGIIGKQRRSVVRRSFGNPEHAGVHCHSEQAEQQLRICAGSSGKVSGRLWAAGQMIRNSCTAANGPGSTAF